MSRAIRRSGRLHGVIPAVLLTFLAAVSGSPEVGRADVVYLKDGFALHGKVRSENALITDPVTGLAVVIKSGNFFIMDDRVRYVIFGHRIVEQPDPETNIRADHLEFTLPLTQNRPMQLPKAARLERYTRFDANWQRKAYLRNELGPYQINQRLTSLTPYSARVESTSYRWNVHYLTEELGRDTVRELLSNHPDLRETSGPDIEKRMKKFRFLLQAGWLVDADQELDRALADLPAEKDRIDRARANLRQAQVRAMWDEVQRAHTAGRFRFVRDFFRRLPAGEIDPKLLAEVNALKTKYDAWDKKIAQAKQLIEFLQGRFVGPMRPAYGVPLAEIREGVNPDTVERLDAFLAVAGQAERDVAAGKAPYQSVENLLALAVTGWVMGKESAEAKVEAAERLWDSRQMVLHYLRTSEPAGRRRLLEEYEKGAPLGIDEMTQLVGMLPPCEPAAPAANALAGGVEKRVTDVPASQNKPVPYLLLVPPEYQPTRAYPVLISLNWSRELPADALSRWAQAAARDGYIVAAPLWTSGPAYSYSADEHNAVLELIRDLRRHYQVDSDRVFLTGFADGATMAFDVGLSHPDLFAGVVPVNGEPRWGASSWYWRNAQYLPFYLVCGEYAGDVTSRNRRLFENFVQRGFASLMTIYRGRPQEFFLGEVPMAIDWMNRKKRATGFPELGRNPNQGTQGQEFQTMRATDNRFYWVTVETLMDKYLNPLLDKDNPTSAAVQANIRDGNHIVVNTRGIRSLKLWLGRVWDAQNGSRTMIDFDKPVRVQVNLSMYGNRLHKITPSLATMLEDLYQRGDRQRLFQATIDLTNVQ
jgi:pimeloyl-ACP methyl ester carboxylesterase